MPETVGELLARVGVDADEVVAEELPHNRWLSPGVWRIRIGGARERVLKYTRSDRSRGETPWDAHWTARDDDPRRWTYWCRESLAYQYDLAGAYAGSGIRAPTCLGVHVDGSEAVLLLEWVGTSPANSGRSRPTVRRQSARTCAGAIPARRPAAGIPG